MSDTTDAPDTPNPATVAGMQELNGVVTLQTLNTALVFQTSLWIADSVAAARTKSQQREALVMSILRDVDAAPLTERVAMLNQLNLDNGIDMIQNVLAAAQKVQAQVAPTTPVAPATPAG